MNDYAIKRDALVAAALTWNRAQGKTRAEETKAHARLVKAVQAYKESRAAMIKWATND